MEEVPSGTTRYVELPPLASQNRIPFQRRSEDAVVEVADDSFFEALAHRLEQPVRSLRQLSHAYVTQLEDQTNNLLTRALISPLWEHFLALETQVFAEDPTYTDYMRGIRPENKETQAPTYFTNAARKAVNEKPRELTAEEFLNKLLSLSEDSPVRTRLGADILNLFMRHPLSRPAPFKALFIAYEHAQAEEKNKIRLQMTAYCKTRDALEYYLMGKSREDMSNPDKPNLLTALYYSRAYTEFFMANYKKMWEIKKQQILDNLLSEDAEYVELRRQLSEEIEELFWKNPTLAEGRTPAEIRGFSEDKSALIWLLRDTSYREKLHFDRACETYEALAAQITKDDILRSLSIEENDDEKEELSLNGKTFRAYKEAHSEITIRVWGGQRENNKNLTLIEKLSQINPRADKELDVLQTTHAPARYIILTSRPFEPLGSFRDFCRKDIAPAAAKINWIKTTLGEARYQTYLEKIGTTHAGLPEIDGVIICSELSRANAPLSLSVTKVDRHGKAKAHSFPTFISPNSGCDRKDTIHLLVHKGRYFIGETPDDTLLRHTYPELRTPLAAPRIEGNMELVGEPIGDPFAYLHKLDRKIARGDENANTARNNLFALMKDLDSPLYTIYRTDNNRFFAKTEMGNGFNENDIPPGDKACYLRINYTIRALFILQLFLAMAPQGAQALVEAREDFNLFWSTMIACDAIFGKMFFLYRISRGNYDNMALTLYDLKRNGKERFKQFAKTITHGTWGAQHIQHGIGYVAMTFPPGLLFAGLVPMAFDGYTGLVVKDGLTSGYLWLSENIAQSEAVRIACGLSSFSTNFFSVPVVLFLGQKTIYGIFWDGKIAFLQNDPHFFSRSRYLASTTAGLGLTAYLADGFFNFYGLSQAIFGPYLGCAILNTTVGNITEAMVANATNATAAFPQYAAPAANVIAGYNLGYMELILLMSAYGFGSNTIKLLFDLIAGDAKLSNLPNHDLSVPPKDRFRLIPQIIIHSLSTIISSSIVLFGSYPNLWQARQTGLTSLNNRITAAGSSAITEVDGTFHGILAFLEGFLRCCYRCQRKKAKEAEAPATTVNDDNQDDSHNKKSSYKNRGCPSFFGWLCRKKVRGDEQSTATEGTALLERSSSGSERTLDFN